MRFDKKRIALIFVFGFIFMIILGAVVNVLSKTEFEYPEIPKSGFYEPIIIGETMVTFTYEFEQNEIILLEGKTLYVDDFNIYAISFDKQQVNLTIQEYEEIIEENITRIVNIHNYSVTLNCYRKYDKVTVHLASTNVKKTVKVYFENKEIFSFYHKTFKAWIPLGVFTHARLIVFLLPHIFLLLALSICAMFFARSWVKKVGYAPDLPDWFYFLLLFAGLIFGVFLGEFLKYMMTIYDIYYLYIPIFMVLVFLSLQVVKPDTYMLVFERTVDSNPPRKILDIEDVVLRKGEFILASKSWLDFLLCRRKKVVFKGQKLWSFQIVGEAGEIFLFKNKYYDDHGNLVVELEDFHALDVDLFLSKLTNAEILAKEKELFRYRFYELDAKKEVIIDQRVREYIEAVKEIRNRPLYLKLKRIEDLEKEIEELKQKLRERELKPVEKEEKTKEGEKVEQKSESTT